MKKMPIEWHEENYKNALSYLSREQGKLEAMRSHVNRISESVSDMRKQLERAYDEKRDGFDADRYKPR